MYHVLDGWSGWSDFDQQQWQQRQLWNHTFSTQQGHRRCNPIQFSRPVNFSARWSKQWQQSCIQKASNYSSPSHIFSAAFTSTHCSLQVRKLRAQAQEPMDLHRTFWLSLPYFYNATLLVLSSLLHWLSSRPFFIGSCFGFRRRSSQNNAFWTSTGFSFWNLLQHRNFFVQVVIAAFCILAIVRIGLRLYAGGIPFVRRNSLAISRACYASPLTRPPDVLHPFQWGVRKYDERGYADSGFVSDLTCPLN